MKFMILTAMLTFPWLGEAKARAASSAPVAPSSLTASASSSAQINLRWSDNSNNEQGFIVQRSLSSSSGFVQVASLGAGVVSYSDLSVASATTYYYRVAAYNRIHGRTAYSSFSNMASAMTLSPTTTTTTLAPTTTTTTTLAPTTTTTVPASTTTTTLPQTQTSWPVLQSIPMGTAPLLPAAPQPGYLSWMPDYGTTNPYTASGAPVSELTRISDATAFNLTGVTFFKHAYSTLSAWNSDESMMLLGVPGSSGYWGVVLNGKTFQWIKNVGSWSSNGRWANNNPRIFYWQHVNGSIVAQDMISNTSTTVRNFSDLGYVSSSGLGWMGGTGNLDLQDRYFPMDLKKSTGESDIVIYDRLTNAVSGVVQLPFTPQTGGLMDSWGMSPSGKYLWMGSGGTWTTRDGVTIPRGFAIFTAQGKYLYSSVPTSSHADFGYDAAGNEVMFFIAPKFGSNDKTGQTWRLDGSMGQQTTAQFTDMVGWMFHVSFAATAKPGWVVVTSMASDIPSNYNKFPMWNHTFAVKLDGSGKIAPLASTHHTNTSQTVNDYDRQPMGVPNRSLTAVLWGGTWGDVDVAGPIHSYVARPLSPPQ